MIDFRRVILGDLAIGVALLLCTAFSGGCESANPSEPGSIPLDLVYPMAQERPDWSRQGDLVYEDNGIACVDFIHGGYQIDTSKVGLWVLDPSTSISRRISSFGITPSWSPDGRRIAFAIPWQGAIFTMNRDGSELQQVTPANGSFAPRWSPDGTQLCWVQRFCEGGCGVWVANSDGTAPKFVLPGGDHPDWNPLAPDTLLCTRWEPQGRGQSIVAVSVNSGGYRTLLPSLSTADRIRATRYSPDGKSIAFVRLGGGPNPAGVYVLGPGATTPRALQAGRVADCCWSPGGDKIAYAKADWQILSQENGTIWTVAVADQSGEQLTRWWPSECDSGAAVPTLARSKPTDAAAQLHRPPGSN